MYIGAVVLVAAIKPNAPARQQSQKIRCPNSNEIYFVFFFFGKYKWMVFWCVPDVQIASTYTPFVRNEDQTTERRVMWMGSVGCTTIDTATGERERKKLEKNPIPSNLITKWIGMDFLRVLVSVLFLNGCGVQRNGSDLDVDTNVLTHPLQALQIDVSMCVFCVYK